VKKLAIGSVLVLAPLAAAGCGGGGSKTLSKEEYGSQLAKLCTDADAQRKALGPINVANIASKGPGLLDALDGLISKVEKLKAPKEFKADADRLIATTKQLRGILAQVVDAAKAKDLLKLPELETKATALTNEADSLGKALGAPACATG
jgi:hypothetical protein